MRELKSSRERSDSAPSYGQRENDVTLSLDRGIVLGCEEVPIAEQVSFNCSSERTQPEVACDASLLITNLDQSYDPVIPGERNIKDIFCGEELGLKEKRYLKIISDCLSYAETDFSLKGKSDLELSRLGNISDILFSLESGTNPCSCDNDSDITKSAFPLEGDCFKSTQSFSPFEHNSTVLEINTANKSKVSHFMAKAGTSILSIVSPTTLISNGIPLAQEVRRTSSAKPIPSERLSPDSEKEIRVTYDCESSFIPNSSVSGSCFERIMHQRQNRNAHRAGRSIEILNNINKELKNQNRKNSDVDVLYRIIWQLDYIEEGHLHLAKEIDRMKTL